MKLKKWMSIAAAVCLAVTAVPMQAAAQAEFAQEMLAESREEPQEEPVEEIVEESKEEPQEELKEEPVEEGKEELQEQPAEGIEPQGEEVSLLTGEENGIVVQENEDNAPFTGEGTEKSPYLIEDVDDLKTLAQKVNSGTTYEGKYFKQTADIDLENETWTPIGTENNHFKGTFDGDSHQITNLKITGSNNYVGLFGYVENAAIKNCNVTGEVNGYSYVGGIVGEADEGTGILNCSFRGNVTGRVGYAGGIAGYSRCEVRSCYVIGAVAGGSKVGGIAGWGAGAIKNCYVLANVTATDGFTGGIAGDAAYNPCMENCYYSGKVSANDSKVGGIAGFVLNSTIKNCVSLAESVTGRSYVNRIVGDRVGGSLTNNYAWSGTKIDNKNDGINLTYENGTLSPQFSEIFGSDNSAWEFTDNGLPILNGVGGAQSVCLPLYLTGESFYGNGTEAIPYLIQNADDLKTLRDKITTDHNATYANAHYKQTADIDLRDVENWQAIGWESNGNTCFFGGVYDGDGHSIKNMTSTNLPYPINFECGFFKDVEYGTVKNLNFENCKVTNPISADCAGILARRIKGATIENCHVISGEVTGNVNHVGGLIGDAIGSEIRKCSFSGTVLGRETYTGGIVGRTVYDSNKNKKTVLSDCYTTGNIAGNNYVGGIIGSAEGTEVSNCYTTADVGGLDYVGGICGNADTVDIANSVVLSKVLHAVYGDVARIYSAKNDNLTFANNYGYNRTKLERGGNTTYADIDTTDAKQGTTVFVSKGKVMTDVQKNEVFDWAANGFTTANGWSIPTEAYKLPSLRAGEYPDLPTLPSKDLTIDETPQHFTTRNIGNGFVVTVLSPTGDIGKTPFTVEYRLHDTNDTWTSDVPHTAGTYDVKITRDADGDINPFVCEISEGLVLTKKRSNGGGSTAVPTYTAQFDTNGGSAVDKAKTDENGKIERPADPTKEGYIFAGWYSDSKLTKRFDFSTALTADTTLYAKWSENNEIILTIGSKKVSVFGSEIENDVAPKIVNDRTMLPIRIVAENLGGTVTWNGALQRVTIQKGADVILITIGADTAYVNGAAVQLDAAAFVENSRTYLPLRFVSENLGAQVAWNETEKTVIITK